MQNMDPRRRVRRYAPRNRKWEIPLGWTHVEKPPNVGLKDTHSYYRCGEQDRVVCEGGFELRRCVFVCRKEYIDAHIRSGKHIFTTPQGLDPGFPRKQAEQEQLHFQRQLRSLVSDKLAELVIRTGISINRASQEAMKAFIVDMINLGMRFKDKHLNVEEALGDFSRRLLTDRIMQFGSKMKERDLQTAREVRFVNVIADAGTVLGKGFIHSMLTNPYSDGFPVILDLMDNPGYDKMKYKEMFSLLILSCLRQGLVVCSVITDGLKAQRSAILELVEESSNPNIRAIIPIYCFAHLSQLVFKDTYTECKEARRITKRVNKLANMLRTPLVVRELGEKCPSTAETRWLYIFDVLAWLYARKEKIDAFLVGSENNRSGMTGLPDEWKEFLLVVTPLKRLNLQMEASSCSLWEVIPIVEKVIEGWKTLCPDLTETAKNIMKHMAACLFTRFSVASPGVVIAAYSLSELGRAILRRSEEGLQTKGSDRNPFVSERIASFNSLFSDSDQQSSTPDRAGSLVGDDVDESESAVPVHSPDEEETMLTETQRRTKTRMMSLALEKLLDTPIYNVTHGQAFAEIERLGNILGIDCNYLHKCFREWLYEDRNDTPTKYEQGQSPNSIWRRVPAVDGHWRDFAQIALRLVTIGTSEADCERSLSKQRDVQGLHANSIRTDLLEARMRY